MNTKTENEIIEDFWVSQGGKPTTIKADIEFYESDWNMLMPVVEKIEGLGFIVQIMRQYCRIQQHQHPFFTTEVLLNEPKINTVYKAVVEFIHWYQTQKAMNHSKTYGGKD